MRFIKLFENFNNQILTSQETNDLIQRYCSWNRSSSEEAEQWINQLLDTEFSTDLSGFKNFPDVVKLYRIIYVEGDINEDFIGFSWTLDEENLYNLDFLESIGLLDNLGVDRDDLDSYGEEFSKMKVISAEFKKEEVDFFFTILNLFRHPLEKEITVKTNPTSHQVEEYDMGKLM
jgi:hypothetical protein